LTIDVEKMVSESIDLSGFLKLNRPIKGVYLLYRNGMVVYIGRTRNLIKRLRDHACNPDMMPLDQVKFIQESNAKNRANIEARLVRHFMPALNKRKNLSTKPKYGTSLTALP
jgi:excinuclease UvrABC nuclease subunit